MKNFIFITIASLMITSCKDSTTNELAIQQRDSLLEVIDERENSVNDFITTFNDIEHNLYTVSEKQHLILLNSAKKGEFSANQKTRINEEIKAINELMLVNTKKIKDLNGKLNRSDKKNAQLEKTIETLNNQLAYKYRELKELNEQLFMLNSQLAFLQIYADTLSNINNELTQTVSNQTNQLHTAYFIIGTSNDLQMWNLVDKEGGFLGIGKTSKVSNNLDMNMFTQIDYIETTTIPIKKKNIKIVSTHPTGSFSLNKTGKMVNSIIISDPKLFWSVSKYLVVSI